MTIAEGTLLGRYRILSPLGAGGMGEVYRARDPHLDRDVAIKVLPAEFAEDADRLRRFEKEARAAGSLSHPNLAAIFDVGAHDGGPFLVMEMLEGSDLRTLLAQQPLPVKKAVAIAAQIASGLAAAHERGIVHRDLKPENLFVTRDGVAKILDFGLAKAQPMITQEGATETATAPMTASGVVLGTAGYMAPEQVQGKPADQRSDIFSFGAVLYEMLSGRRAFRGATPVETLNAILNVEPAEIGTAERPVPPVLDRIVMRCLEKDPARRFRTAYDLAFALETASTASSGATSVAGVAVRHRVPAAAMAIGLVVLMAAAAAAGVFWGRATATHTPPSFKLLTHRRGAITGARFAKDNRTILYSAAWDGGPSEIFSTRTENPEAKSLGLPPALLLSVSSKDELAILLTTDRIMGNASGTLARVPLLGGAPRELLADVLDADWAPDGERLCVLRSSPTGGGRIEFPIGTVLVEGDIAWPRVSPKGNRIAFVGDAVEVVDLSGRRQVLSRTPSFVFGLAWSPDGNEVWFTAGTGPTDRALYAVTLTGKQRLIAQGAGSMSVLDVAANGRALVMSGFGRLGVAAGRLDGPGERELGVFTRSEAVGATNDAVLIAEYTFDKALAYVRRWDGSAPLRIGEGLPMAISSDGTRVLLGVDSGRVLEQPTGAGQPKTIQLGDFTPEIDTGAARWSGDGRRLFLMGHRPSGEDSIFVREGESGPWRAVVPEGSAAAYAVAPDGGSIAVQSAAGVVVYPLSGSAPRTYAGVRGTPMAWAPSGRSIYVRRGQTPAIIEELDLDKGTLRLIREIMPADPTGITAVMRVVFAPDLKAFAYGYSRGQYELYLVEGAK